MLFHPHSPNTCIHVLSEQRVHIHTGARLSTTNSMAAGMGKPLVCLLLPFLLFLLPGVGVRTQGTGPTMGGTSHRTVCVPYALSTLHGSPQVHGKHSILFDTFLRRKMIVTRLVALVMVVGFKRGIRSMHTWYN